jgi:hypothetical protein
MRPAIHGLPKFEKSRSEGRPVLDRPRSGDRPLSIASRSAQRSPSDKRDIFEPNLRSLARDRQPSRICIKIARGGRIRNIHHQIKRFRYKILPPAMRNGRNRTPPGKAVLAALPNFPLSPLSMPPHTHSPRPRQRTQPTLTITVTREFAVLMRAHRVMRSLDHAIT